MGTWNRRKVHCEFFRSLNQDLTILIIHYIIILIVVKK